MPLSIGQRLKQAREERNFSLQKAEQDLRIRSKILEALESDDYSSISSGAQARGFLKNYCEYLQVDLDAALHELQTTAKQEEGISGPLPQIKADLPLELIAPADEVPPRAQIDELVSPQQAESTPEEESSKSSTEESTSPKRSRKKKISIDESVPNAESSLTDESNTKPKRGRKKKETAAEDVIPVYADPTPFIVEEPKPEAESQIEESSEQGTALETSLEQIPAQSEATPLLDEDKPQVEEEAKLTLIDKLKSLIRITSRNQETVEAVPSSQAEELPRVINVPDQSPEEIFAGIGKQLRARRDLLSLSLDEVELHTRVRAVFLQALEEGSFDKLPSTVQMRGMLTNYATFLDLDTDAILLRFADALQLRHRLKYPDKPVGTKPPMPVATTLPPLRSFMAGDLIFGSLIVAVLFGLAIWGIGRVISLQTDQKLVPTAFFTPNVLSTGETALPDVTSTPIVDVTQQVVIDTPSTIEIPLQPAQLQMMIVASERTYLRVTVDGQIKFEGRAAPGSSYDFDAQNTIEVLTGNAAALHITFNGRDQGLLGGFGEVVSRIYTLEGIVTPTATLPPTPTNTPEFTPTPPITDTPTPTETTG